MKDNYFVDINALVFDVFKSVKEMNYSKNEKVTFFDMIKKLYRYVVSGYLLSVPTVNKKMNEFNIFKPSNHVYHGIKVAIYTVSTGKYDKIKEPIYRDKNIDYFVFTDAEIPADSVWKKIIIPKELREGMQPLSQARYLKTHPHLFFNEYDYSIFIDGNIRITCDIMPLVYTMIYKKKFMAIHKHQVRDCAYDEAKAVYAAGKSSKKELKRQCNHYINEGFPHGFGLFETNVIIREHSNPKCVNIMNTWWDEINNYTKRDQMSLTYSIWKNGENIDTVLSLGNNSRLNPYFIVDSHN